MKKIVALALLITLTTRPTHIFIENWSSYPIIVSDFVTPESGALANVAPFAVQPGQNAAVKVTTNELSYTNFNRLTLRFKLDGYTKQETLFFPDEATAEASLSFGNSGYKRSPFNILSKNIAEML